MRVLLIAGLPASGKTHLGKQIAASENGIFIDDPKTTEILPNCDFLIIADPYFCFKSIRNIAVQYLKNHYDDITIEWIFFENNPEQCHLNAKSRPEKAVGGLINILSKSYQIPENSKIIPVYKSLL